MIKYNYLFDFSVSYSRGGLRRLSEYVKWFHGNGGSNFNIHENCTELLFAKSVKVIKCKESILSEAKNE